MPRIEKISSLPVTGGFPVYPDLTPVFIPTSSTDPESEITTTSIKKEKQKKKSQVKKLRRKIRKILKSLLQRVMPTKISKKPEICIIKADFDNPSFNWEGENLQGKKKTYKSDTCISITAEELKKAKTQLKVSNENHDKSD